MIRMILYILIGLVLLTLGYIWFFIRPNIGSNPDGAHRDQIRQSSQFSKERGKFVNPHQAMMDESEKKMDTWEVTKAFFFPKNQVTPKSKLPEIKPNWDNFLSPTETSKLIWLGHSTFLVRIAEKTLLIDPVFSKAASPDGFLSPRFQPPVVSLDELPDIDVILISHDHYDHLDAETVRYFAKKSNHFLVPLGIRSHLEYWGVNPSRVTELDWWQDHSIDGIQYTCTPSQHFSGRLLPTENKTLWAGWTVKTENQNIFYSGDSGYSDHFKKIGDRLGPFDLAVIENGQYNEQWRPVHTMPEETAQAYFDLQAKALLPVHWGMFNLSLHNWYDPINEIEKHSREKGIQLLTPKIGQMFELGNLPEFERWWTGLR